MPFTAVRQQIAPFSPGSGRIIAVLVVLTVVGGFAEAGALVMVAHSALAVTGGEDTVLLPLGIEIATGAALLVSLLALLTKLGLSVIGARLSARLSARTVRFGRRVLLDAFFKADWATQSQERLGELQDYLTTSVGRLNAVNQAFVSGINALVSFSVIILTAVAINPLAAIGSAVAGAMLLLLLRPLTKLTRGYSRQQSDATRHLASSITESVRLAQEIRVFGVRRAMLDRLDMEELSASRPLELANFTTSIAPAIYQTLALAFLVLAVWAVRLASGTEVASLGAAVVLLLRGLTYGQQLQTSMQTLANTLPFLEAMHDRRRSYTVRADVPGHLPIGPIGDINFTDVTFAYHSATPVLRNLTFHIRPFESIGVVGPSGSGKSTLLQLLLRLRPPTGGLVTVDGVDLWDISGLAWAERVAFVPQDARLLDGTIADNISFFRDLDAHTIEQAARLAHIHDEIVSWPDGYHTRVGDSGARLSGGQRQRVAIARALAARPSFIILDEPTSALDMPSEQRFQATLEGLRGTVGLVIVAHRLSTVQHSDRILVLNDGVLEGFASHAELLGHSQFYRDATDLSGTHPAEENNAC